MKILLVEAIVFIALYTDLKFHKIPNLLTFPAMLAGFLLNIPNNWVDSILGLTLVLAAFIPVYIMGAAAAGDVKVLMAVGLTMGYRFMLTAILFIIFFNLIITAIILAKKKKLGYVLRFTYTELKYRFLFFLGYRRKVLVEKPDIKPEVFIPYMPAVAIGINLGLLIR